MKKIGILGGTFNPIHNGHLALASAAMEQYGLEEVWLMPSKLPPHKSHFAMLSEEERLYLTRLAAKANSKFIVSDFELTREGLTYTADTLELLTKEFPDVRFYFIIGGDSLVNFLSWRRPERILELASLLAAGRAGYEEEQVIFAAASLRKQFPEADINTVVLDDYPISSNEIREAFFTGEPERVKQYLPDRVYAYLQENRLFSKVTFSELDAEMQRILPRKRYLHSVAVAHLAAAYYVSLGYDPKHALIAGILHDCAKAYSDEQLVSDCEKYSVPVTEVERRNGFLLHGKLGAYYARKRYFITDEEILSAISYHTTGRPGMTDLEKVVFLADYLEPFRTQPTTPDLNEIRRIAFQDIDKAVYLALKNTLRYLGESGQEIDMTTADTFKEYQKRYE
ncbi:MAG: nicotinate-nucleotide adenylyltransferase [Lachnospiraceae bacterium]|nr:nicotinate-nucleotide adenylyltransferase [Lachnospiraceae bacterium]